MNLIITPFEDLYKEAENIQSFLEITMSEDASEAQLRGNKLMVYIARTGKMKADAKYWLSAKKQSEVMETLRQVAKETPYATSKAVNALIDSLCREEEFLYNMIERLNRTATHQYEWCRTLISAAKSEFLLNKNSKQH